MNISKMKRSTVTALCAVSAAILSGASRAEEPVGGDKPAEMEAEETQIVSGEFSLSFDSKYLSYGFVDNNHPILTPAGSLTFFDWVTIGVSAIYDTTKYGHKHGYTSRQWEYTELHPTVTIGHSFSPEDYDWLPTTVEIALGYDYEYVPNSKRKGTRLEDEETGAFLGYDKSVDEDTQYWTAEIALPDLWLEPCLYIEQDAMRDHGLYVNLELGHTFALIDGEGEEDRAVLRLAHRGAGDAAICL